MFTQKQVEDLVDLLLELDNETKIYIGTDSVRFRKTIVGMLSMLLLELTTLPIKE